MYTIISGPIVIHTSLSTWNPTCPGSIESVFLRFDHMVYTTSTLFILQPSMLFALTSWAASSKTADGISSIVWPWKRNGITLKQEHFYSFWQNFYNIKLAD